MLHELISTLIEPFNYLASPHKRIFWLYIVASIVLVLAVTLFRVRSISRAYTHLKPYLRPTLWWNQSSWVDVQWIFVNHVLRVFIVVPILGGQVALALAVNRGLGAGFGEGNFFAIPAATTALIFTVCLFLIEDFSRFFVHLLYHKLPWLWRFHAIHHSAPTLTPLTLYRIHFIEMAINSGRSLLAVGITSGIFLYLFKGSISNTTILGAALFNFIFNMAGANLRHSPFWLGFGIFERWFISPAQHQIHHSVKREHYDLNFGSALAIWDRLFGTWIPSKNQKVEAFGIEGIQQPQKIHTQFFGIKTSNP